jgi:hypothetical protein
MVDKAEFLQIDGGGQAGTDDLKTYFPELKVPLGVTWQDPEAAEEMIEDWEESPEPRAFGLAIKIYEHLREAVLAAEKEPPLVERG